MALLTRQALQCRHPFNLQSSTVRLHLISFGDLITGMFPVQSVTLDLFMLQAHIANCLWTSPSRCTSSSSNMACLFKKLPLSFLHICYACYHQPPSLPSSAVLSFPSPTSPTGFQVLPILLASVFPVFISSVLGETAISFPSQWPSKWPIRLF